MPIKCPSWFTKCVDAVRERNREEAVGQQNHPIAPEHPQQMDEKEEDERPQGTDRRPGPREPDGGIPGHVGFEKQLHSGTGYNLVIGSDGEVYGTREPYSEDAILRFSTRAAGEVQIRGKESDLYLAMDERGRVYAESDKESENTWFREEYYGGWNHYTWLGNDNNWLLGIKKNGKMKKGHRTNKGQSASKFLPRSARPASLDS